MAISERNWSRGDPAAVIENSQRGRCDSIKSTNRFFQMRWIAKISFYLRSLFSGRKLEVQMTEEMRVHLEMETEAKIASGMSSEEARVAAAREFGNVASVQERTRDERGWVWPEQCVKDIGFAVRSLVRARAFTLAAVATLAVGIGVATVVFDLSSWILFHAQPYPDPSRLYLIGYKDKQGAFTIWRSGLYFQAYREQTDVCTEYAAVKADASNVVIEDTPVFANVRRTSIDCFHTLGVRPALGRTFLPEEHLPGADNVVVLSDLFWRQHFHASADVLSRKVRIDEQICTVVGVLAATQMMPAPFAGDVYRPFVPVTGPQNFKANPTCIFDPTLAVIGRLRDGVTMQRAQSALAAIKLTGLPDWAMAYFAGQQTTLRTLVTSNRPEIYWVMMIAAAFLYAIACLNTMNLTLVRLLARRRELSIRLAIGGSRGQIARLLIIENVILSFGSGLVVILAARWFFPALFVLINHDEAVRYRSYWDWDTLGCTGILSLFAGVAVLLVPVIRLLKTSSNATLKESGTAKGESVRMGRTRNLLVSLQAALAVVLLAGTGLMVRSFEKLHEVDLGFDPAGKVKVQIFFPPGHKPANLEARLQLFSRLKKKLTFLPGVEAVSYGSDALLIGAFYGTAQLQMANGTFEPAAGSYVGDDLDRTVGLMLKKGHWVSDMGTDHQVVINETLAKKRFGSQNPIGQSIKIQADANPLEIVGVIKDIRDDARSPAGMHIYFQNRISFPLNINTLFIRFNRSSGVEFAETIRKALYEFDPSLIAVAILPLVDVLNNSMIAEQYAYTILRGLTSIALALASIGMFAVLTFAVSARMQEFGVRTALGATPADLHRLVMTRGLKTVTVGLGIGLFGALALTRFMQSLLFETSPNEPVVYLIVTVVLLSVAMLACWLPARRAAKIDPIVALRGE